MKLLAIVVLSGILPLFSSAMYAAGEEQSNAVDATQTDFISAAEANLVLRSTMPEISFGMGFKGPSFAVSKTAFNLRSIGMNTEGYITAWDAGAGQISTPIRTSNAPTALSNQSLPSLFIVCLLSFTIAFVTWLWRRQTVEKYKRHSQTALNPNKVVKLTRRAHD